MDDERKEKAANITIIVIITHSTAMMKNTNHVMNYQ